VTDPPALALDEVLELLRFAGNQRAQEHKRRQAARRDQPLGHRPDRGVQRQRVRQSDHIARPGHPGAQVIRLNLLLLMAVAFLPFPTRLMAEAIRDSGAERAAVIFYGGAVLVISLLLGAIWVVARRSELLRPDVSEREVNAVLLATTPVRSA
jgi:hypothetical protein